MHVALCQACGHAATMWGKKPDIRFSSESVLIVGMLTFGAK